VRRRRVIFIAVVQSILLLAHAFVYETWMAFAAPVDPPGVPTLAIVFALLSISFVAASLLAFRYYNIFVRVFYTLAASWLGILNFCFLGVLRVLDRVRRCQALGASLGSALKSQPYFWGLPFSPDCAASRTPRGSA
jgi:hypothetical protein